MMAKNMPAGEAVWKISYRFILDTVSAVKSLMEGESRYFFAVFRAHWAFLLWLFSGRSKRDGLEKKNYHRGGYFDRSVVWAHFVKGKKYFNEIVNLKE